MLDDTKRTIPVKLWLTEREFHDLSRTAHMSDRKTAEMGRVFVRRSMYGILNSDSPDINRANSPDIDHD